MTTNNDDDMPIAIRLKTSAKARAEWRKEILMGLTLAPEHFEGDKMILDLINDLDITLVAVEAANQRSKAQCGRLYAKVTVL